MTEAPPVAGVRAAELRQAFDQSFAAAVRTVAVDFEDLLGLRVAGDAYAVRLGEITALLPERKIVALPGPLPELLGVAGLRGGMVPIYSLRALLGYGAGTERASWIITAGVEQPVGLAFERFEGHLRIPRAVITAAPGVAPRAHVTEAARVAPALRGIISVRSIVKSIEERIGRLGGVAKER